MNLERLAYRAASSLAKLAALGVALNEVLLEPSPNPSALAFAGFLLGAAQGIDHLGETVSVPRLRLGSITDVDERDALDYAIIDLHVKLGGRLTDDGWPIETCPDCVDGIIPSRRPRLAELEAAFHFKLPVLAGTTCGRCGGTGSVVWRSTPQPDRPRPERLTTIYT